MTLIQDVSDTMATINTLLYQHRCALYEPDKANKLKEEILDCTALWNGIATRSVFLSPIALMIGAKGDITLIQC